MIVLATVSSLVSQVQPSPTADALSALPAREAAQGLLSPETAARVVHHEVRGPSTMAPPSESGRDIAEAVFHTAAVEAGPGLCRRERIWVRAERRPDAGSGGFQPVGRAAPGEQLRLDTDCASAADRPFADLQVEVEDAAPVLARLRELRDQARARADLDVRVACTTDTRAYLCPSDAAGVLADLPLEGAFQIRRGDGADQRIRVSATETRPGGLFWEIWFSEADTVLNLKRRIPPPF